MATKNYTNWINKSPAAQRQLGGTTAFDANMPPQFVLDKIAERQISGGFNVKKKNLCCTCNTFKCANGTCLC